jgi:hypothetical protein
VGLSHFLSEIDAEEEGMRLLLLIAILPVSALAFAQQPCPEGIRIEGSITDPAGAVIPGAQIETADGTQTVTDAAGNFVLPCVPARSTILHVQAAGFTPGIITASAQTGGIAHVNLQLAIAQVQTEVHVSADTASLGTDQGAGTRTLTTEDIQQLPDDPDDLLQQLQLLASTGGGAATSATIVVDGFQNGSAMPPKSAIASIRVNPDPISPEYERPNSEGGRVEIITKPGASSFHGALFFTDSDSIFNANDPFSVTATPAGKRRYGFELSGPVIAKKSGFALALEKRDINEFNVVNALSLDVNQNQIAQHQTVAAPQQLWIASARGDWQTTQRDVATLSYSANVNSQGNQGVGGLTLEEAGYSSRVAEYDLRFTNTYTANANLLHETRIGYTWKRTEQNPNSTAPALQVAGYFNGGGATSQDLDNRERDLEIDDDVLITKGKHELKIGAQSLGIFVHNYDPDTFNGAYVFGGGSAPVLDGNNNPTGQTTTITAIEQYRRALLNLPGGSPTTYQINTGTPLVPYAQWRVAFYGEDTMKLLPRLTVTAGVRYSFQTSPSTFLNLGPRLGLAWSPDKKESWTLHLRGGIFNMSIDPTDAAQAYRLNGVRQQEALVYSPDYNHPLIPIPGSIQVGTVWQFTHAFEQIPVSQIAIGIERDLPHHWHPSVWYTRYSAWGDSKTANINAPLVNSSSGNPVDPTAALLSPRPGMPNMNVFEYQNSAHTVGSVFWAGIEQKSYKRWTINMGLWNVNFYGNTGTPQSSYSNRGEFARPDWQSSGALAESDLKLPYKIELSTQAYWHYGTPYNITTGIDANGDGTFNDRPSYASAPGPGVYSTPFGLMTTNAVNGDVPRNLGTMPTIVHMYSNLSRAFKIGPQDNDHPYTLTFNVRSSNLLNHTNATAVGTVVSSPNIGQPLSAEAARRVELGVRFAF